LDADRAWRLDASTLRRYVASGELSSEALVRATLARIEALDGQARAFVTVDADAALAAAREADALRRRTTLLPPLHGLPVAVKDVIATAGLRTTFGSRLYAGHVPERDAAAVARVRRAGGIVIGKTTTPEFAHKVLTDSLVSGVTRNPWSAAHSAGGSSGGAAVAAAMGFASLNVATDGAGSARVPASCCGVVGLKPTMGRIPNEGAPDVFGLQVIGLIARSVADLRLLLGVLAGPLDADPLSWGARPGRDPVTGLAGLRVRWLPRMGNAHVAADVLAACTRTLAAMEAAGAIVDEGTAIDWAHDACRMLLRAQQAARFRALPDAQRDLLDPGFRACVDEGVAQRAADLQDAMLARTALFRRVQGLLDGADVLASPVVATPALSATHAADQHVLVDGHDGGSLREGWYCYTVPFNATGHPAIVLPCGVDRAGVPIGLQLVAPWLREHRLLRIAQALRGITKLPERWPPAAEGVPAEGAGTPASAAPEGVKRSPA